MIILPYGHVLLIASKLNASVCSISSGRGILVEEEEKELELTRGLQGVRVIFHAFFCLLFLYKSPFSKSSFRNTIRVSDSLDPDQALYSVGPDLVPN